MVDVPITVIIPPIIAAYDKGIRNLPGETLFFFAHWYTYGINKATIGVLFKNADNAVTPAVIRNMNDRGLFVFPNNVSSQPIILK